MRFERVWGAKTGPGGGFWVGATVFEIFVAEITKMSIFIPIGRGGFEKAILTGKPMVFREKKVDGRFCPKLDIFGFFSIFRFQ